MGSMNEGAYNYALAQQYELTDNTYHCAHVAHAVVSNDDGPELVHKPAYCDAGLFSPIHPPSYSTIVSPSTCFLPTVEKDDGHKTYIPYDPDDALDFPTVYDGARGVHFIEKTVASSGSLEKWTDARWQKP